MQNIMISYYKEPAKAGIMPQSLMEIFKDTPYQLVDCVIIVYVFLFALWIASFMRSLYFTIKSMYRKDSAVMDLHKATYNNDTLAALKLCQSHPEAVNKTIDKDGYTPFLRACYHGNTQLVKYMLEIGADIKSKTTSGENAFYLAVYNRIKNRKCKDASCIHALYHAGVDLNIANTNNLNVLQLAAMFGHTSLTRWLLSKNANFDVEPSPYMLAKSSGHTETANLLRELHLLSE